MRYGLIIDYNFHLKNNWVSALTPYLVNDYIDIFDPIIITNQNEYEKNKKNIKAIFMMEPGWAAPFIRLDSRLRHVTGMLLSDPHSKKEWFEKYFFSNKINYLLSYYYYPFFFHFPEFPKKNFVHFPWAVPDQFIVENNLIFGTNEVSIFGGKKNDAYDVRNWCREQTGIVNYEFSGTENKKLSDLEYFEWLRTLQAVVAAGSSSPIYDLVTPKYFEIAASGALLIGQYCKDLAILGFDEANCIIFTKKNFNQKISDYKRNPSNYLNIRNNGRKLIKDRHTINSRLKLLKELFNYYEEN